MIKAILLFGLLSASLSLQGCKTAAVKNLQGQNEQTAAQTQIDNSSNANNAEQKIEKTNATSQTVNFKGVSFNYNPQIFGAVKMEKVAELPLCENCKADSVAPEHLLFNLENSNFNRKAEIYIFPIEDYRRMYAVSSEVTKRFDDELKGLKMAIKDKNFRLENQIPFIPTWDGSQTFQSKVKNFTFQSGRGIFFLTQFDIEVTLINNEDITYCFEGITNDKKYYILAEFPVKVSFLTGKYTDEFEGYQIPKRGYIETGNELKQHKEYVAKVARRLEDLPSDKYEPNLKYFEEIISSLKIEK